MAFFLKVCSRGKLQASGLFNTYIYIFIYYTSSTAQGGGGSFNIGNL